MFLFHKNITIYVNWYVYRKLFRIFIRRIQIKRKMKRSFYSLTTIYTRNKTGYNWKVKKYWPTNDENHKKSKQIHQMKLTLEIHLPLDKHTPSAPVDYEFDVPFVELFSDYGRIITNRKLNDPIDESFVNSLNCIPWPEWIRLYYDDIDHMDEPADDKIHSFVLIIGMELVVWFLWDWWLR